MSGEIEYGLFHRWGQSITIATKSINMTLIVHKQNHISFGLHMHTIKNINKLGIFMIANFVYHRDTSLSSKSLLLGYPLEHPYNKVIDTSSIVWDRGVV